MTSEAQTTVADPVVERAARLLAASESRTDGWCPAGEHLTNWGSGETESALVEAWTERLRGFVRERPGVKIILDGDAAYPSNLRAVEGRPALLFVEGQIASDDRRALAIVGSREADDVAIGAAMDVAGELAALGYTVVSGLARGIDTAAHKGAVQAGGRTIAVVGTGIDRVFPPENGRLLNAIRGSGAIVSQFPPGHGPTKTTFPARNAVIAGLSLGSVVVTASERSGTRIEIDRTLDQGRPVLLLGPFLRSQPWARRLAAHPLVHFVDSPDDINRIVIGGS